MNNITPSIMRLAIPGMPWRWRLSWRLKGAEKRRLEFMRLIRDDNTISREAMMRSLLDIGLWQDEVDDKKRRVADDHIDRRTDVFGILLSFLRTILSRDTGLWNRVEVNRQILMQDTFAAIRSERPLSFIQLIMESGIPVDCRSKDKPYDTLLTASVKVGRLDLVRFLMGHGADIEQVDEQVFMTPLHHAIKSNQIEMIDLLLELGADINGAGKKSWDFIKTPHYPILLACRTGNLDLVRTLVERGANVHQVGYQGNNALHAATFHHYNQNGGVIHMPLDVKYLDTAPLIQYLIEQNVALDRVNENGDTPLNTALRLGKIEDALIMLKAMNSKTVRMQQHSSFRVVSLLIGATNPRNPFVRPFLELFGAYYPETLTLNVNVYDETIEQVLAKSKNQAWREVFEGLCLENATQSSALPGVVRRL